jgi:hypothetical protein
MANKGLVALTQIRHGKEDGELVVVDQFDPLPKGLFSKDEVEALVAGGSVGEAPVAAADDDEVQELRDEVARLQAELQARTGQGEPSAEPADGSAQPAPDGTPAGKPNPDNPADSKPQNK